MGGRSVAKINIPFIRGQSKISSNRLQLSFKQASQEIPAKRDGCQSGQRSHQLNLPAGSHGIQCEQTCGSLLGLSQKFRIGQQCQQLILEGPFHSLQKTIRHSSQQQLTCGWIFPQLTNQTIKNNLRRGQTGPIEETFQRVRNSGGRICDSSVAEKQELLPLHWRFHRKSEIRLQIIEKRSIALLGNSEHPTTGKQAHPTRILPRVFKLMHP